MTSRLETTFQQLRAANQTGLVTFLMASDPDHNSSLAALKALPEAGADIIELGMPFSDPMADGPAIQAAAQRALTTGASMQRTLKMVEDFRKENSTTPLILMGYYNPIFHYGAEKFCVDAKAAGVDGLIIVDVPFEEEQEVKIHLQGLDLIRLIAPTTIGDRLPKLVKDAKGFIYYISITGITGTASATAETIAQGIAEIRKYSQTPVAAGFGIKTPEQAAALKGKTDAVVVGSAIVEKIGKHQTQAALELVRELKAALR